MNEGDLEPYFDVFFFFLNELMNGLCEIFTSILFMNVNETLYDY